MWQALFDITNAIALIGWALLILLPRRESVIYTVLYGAIGLLCATYLVMLVALVGNLVDPIARLVIPLPLEPCRHKAHQVLHNVPLNGPDKLQVIHDIQVVVEAGINDPAQPVLHPLHPLHEQHLTLPSLNLLHQPRHPLTHMRMIPRNPTYPI